jgi:tetratricopeptide (TPR) repeat protein
VPATPWGKRALAVAATGVIAVYASLGFVQVGQWHDGLRLFRHALAVADDNEIARYNLAYALVRRGEFPEALVHLQRAIELAPNDPAAYYMAASTLQEQGRSDEATVQFQRAIALDDRNAAQVHHEPRRNVWVPQAEARNRQPEFLTF